MAIEYFTNGDMEPVSGDAISSKYSCSLYAADTTVGYQPGTDGANGWADSLLDGLSSTATPFACTDPSGMLDANGYDINIQRAGRYLVTAQCYWTPIGTWTPSPDFPALALVMRAETPDDLLVSQASVAAWPGKKTIVSLSFVHWFHPTDPNYYALRFRACPSAANAQHVYDTKINVRWLAGL